MPSMPVESVTRPPLDLFALASSFVEVPVSSWRSAPWWFFRLCLAVFLSLGAAAAFTVVPAATANDMSLRMGIGIGCSMATVILLVTLLTANGYSRVTRFARKARHRIGAAVLGLSVAFSLLLAIGAGAAALTPTIGRDPQVLLLLATIAVLGAFWGWMALMLTPPVLSTAPTADLHRAGRAYTAMTAAAVILVVYTCWFLSPQLEVAGSFSVALVAAAACLAWRNRALAAMEAQRQRILAILDDGIAVRTSETHPGPLASSLLPLQSAVSVSPFAPNSLLSTPMAAAWEVQMILAFLVWDSGDGPFPPDLEKRREQLEVWQHLGSEERELAIRGFFRALRRRIVA
ncbi:hypothetical protein [uncultured Microbacterium sp.]|uniref:hypothetical protein n=1 Tax=uncultured Microbacterium sp. TaxID=191216 RepID=UPI0028ED9471|nr:hypothetical protein [uncultured Microbacterium sp.]